ncbi:MAG TPA: energy transducer TonB, partial [Opitutus sp.]|nr:energy transducer TonB [Opitutus sp.]
MKGALPEVCLMIMEHLPPNPTTAADMKSLLNRMQQSARPQSFIALATHAFLGWGMPYDLTLARSMARAAAADSPADSTRMLAAIDSIAADSPAARQQARDLLRHLADGGDNEAARLVAYRAMTGIGEELDPDAARKYDQIALQTSSLTARQREGAEHYLSSLCHPPPRESEIAERIARLGPRSGDTPVAVVYRMPPSYPVDLRSAGIEGSAEVAFVVDQSGHARDVTCPSSTHPYFARAAESAIRQWRFAPALKDGQPVATSLRQTIQFNLSGSDAKSPSTHSAP